jgi:hypothetical protein
MDHASSSYPKSRHDGLLIDHVGDETIVYDEQRQEAHSLNRTASLVWERSDGAHSVPELAAVVGTELGIDANESLVEYALEELSRVNLLDAPVSRRDAVRRLTVAGAAVIAIPVVLSIAAPSPAMAASGTQNGQGQNNNG